MKIKVGQYELVTTEEFKTEKEAVARFLEFFPDANPEKVKAKVKPYFNNNAKSSVQPLQQGGDRQVNTSATGGKPGEKKRSGTATDKIK